MPQHNTHPATQQYGDASRARQDAQTGAAEYVAENALAKHGAQHMVSEGLRRSIADSYRAFIGAVDQVPQDEFGLALYALDRAYGPAGFKPTGSVDFNLQTSPFCISKTKHAAIHNTARRIIGRLDKYVKEVAPYCPPPLKDLAAPGARSAALLHGAPPAVPHRPRPRGRGGAYPGGSAGEAGARPRTAPAAAAPGRPLNGGGMQHGSAYAQDDTMRGLGGPSFPGKRPAARPPLPHAHPPQDLQPQQHLPQRESAPARVRAEPAMRPARLGGKRAAIKPVVPGGPLAPLPTHSQASRQGGGSRPIPVDVAAVAAVSVAAAARAGERAEREDAVSRGEKARARVLLQEPHRAGGEGGGVWAGSGTPSPPRGMPEQQWVVLEAQARAALPPWHHNPPHLRVSEFYDHVKPAASLEQYHAMLAAKEQVGRAASPSVVARGVDGQGEGSPTPHRVPSPAAGDHPHSAAARSYLEAGRAASPVPRAMTHHPHGGAGEGIAQALGFTVSDSQLLRLIGMYKSWVAEAERKVQEDAARSPHPINQPAWAASEFTKACLANRSGVASPNRSRRLEPTEEDLFHMRGGIGACAGAAPAPVAAFEGPRQHQQQQQQGVGIDGPPRPPSPVPSRPPHPENTHAGPVPYPPDPSGHTVTEVYPDPPLHPPPRPQPLPPQPAQAEGGQGERVPSGAPSPPAGSGHDMTDRSRRLA